MADLRQHGEPLPPLRNDHDIVEVYLVLVQFAGGSTWSPWSSHRTRYEADVMASAQRGRVYAVPYYDGEGNGDDV